jgi:RHS repeat-associated protein
MGNLKSLVRYGKTSGTSFNVIDQLTYHYKNVNINQLDAVSDSKDDTASPSSDFIDNGFEASFGEYGYDANGNQTKDVHKKIENIFYNHLNLARQINFVSSRASNGTFLVNRIEFGYDAAGVKLWKKVTENGIIKSKTDYLGEFFYENNQLQFIHTPEGRIVANGNSFTNEYHYKDHLGNLRLAFGKERSWLMSAELDKKISEEATFTYLLQRRTSEKASTGTFAVKLIQNQLVETILIDTRKGNSFTLNFEAFSNEGTSNGRTSSEMQLGDISLNTPLLTNSYKTDNEGNAKFTPNLNLLALVKLFKRQSTNLRTSSLSYNVQLKIEFFDKNKTLKSSNIEVINLNASIWANGQYTLPSITDNTIAFVKFTLVNPNTFPIFIDNWKIEEKGKVILQENHYDPYGASLFGIEKTGNHEFLYQGKERMEELGLHWDDFEWRNYDITYFRTPTIDPHAEKYVNWSPYSWVMNNPISRIDPDGRDGILTVDKEKKTAMLSMTIHTSRMDMKNLSKMMNPSGLEKSFEQLLGSLHQQFSSEFPETGGEESPAKIDVDGESYDVSFSLNFEVHDTDEARDEAWANDKTSNRLKVYAVGDSDYLASYLGDGSRTFRFNASSPYKDNTMGHEYLHGIGKEHSFPTKGDVYDKSFVYPLSSYGENRQLMRDDYEGIISNAIRRSNASKENVVKMHIYGEQRDNGKVTTPQPSIIE